MEFLNRFFGARKIQKENVAILINKIIISNFLKKYLDDNPTVQVIFSFFDNQKTYIPYKCFRGNNLLNRLKGKNHFYA